MSDYLNWICLYFKSVHSVRQVSYANQGCIVKYYYTRFIHGHHMEFDLSNSLVWISMGKKQSMEKKIFVFPDYWPYSVFETKIKNF